MTMMPAKDGFAIELNGVNFHYLTPRRIPILRNIPFLRRTLVERHDALKDVHLNVRSNRITALLGKNGSGKTSLIKLITGARYPHAGSIRIFGEHPTKVRHRMGLCFGGDTLIYHRLTGRENLEYFGRLYNVANLKKRISELVEMVNLEEAIDQMVETYSFGMRVKLGLIRSMIHSPDLLILDEPTLGIDLHLAQNIRRFIRSLSCSVLFTTHYMEEAEMLSDDLCFIDKGKILIHGEKSEVLKKVKANSVPEAFTRTISETREFAAC